MKIPLVFTGIILLFDLIAFNLSWWAYYYIRAEIQPESFYIQPELLWQSSVIITIYWVLIFFISGLYRVYAVVSRFDEVINVVKTTIVGALIISFLIFLDEVRVAQIPDVRFVILVYWTILVSLVIFLRLLIRTIQRRLIVKGILARDTVVIGTGKRAQRTARDLAQYPALGYRCIGFIAHGHETPVVDQVLGQMDQLPDLIRQKKVQDIIIATEREDRDLLTYILNMVTEPHVGVSIVPDLYDVISGQARTNQIYGFPIVRLNPHYLSAMESATKRLVDLLLALVILVVTSPVMFLTAILIRLESEGPAFYLQERVGQDGKLFKLIKFRSMVQDAEKKSGPVWAAKDDPRITKVGRFIRKFRIDELPQLFNVFKGEMSMIGPRPERGHFVEKFKSTIPFYERRLRVKPGITGYAQVKHKYDESEDDVAEKLKFDLYYIENMSLKMDITIIFHTFFTLIRGKGQ